MSNPNRGPRRGGKSPRGEVVGGSGNIPPGQAKKLQDEIDLLTEASSNFLFAGDEELVFTRDAASVPGKKLRFRL